LGKLQKTVLIAANIENHQNITLSHIEKAVTPDAFLPAKMEDMRTNDRHVCSHILRNGIGEAPTDQIDISPGASQSRNRLPQLLLAKVPEAFANIFQRMFHRRIGSIRPAPRQFIAMVRRLQLRRKLILQSRLKIGIILKSEPVHEA